MPAVTHYADQVDELRMGVTACGLTVRPTTDARGPRHSTDTEQVTCVRCKRNLASDGRNRRNR